MVIERCGVLGLFGVIAALGLIAAPPAVGGPIPTLTQADYQESVNTRVGISPFHSQEYHLPVPGEAFASVQSHEGNNTNYIDGDASVDALTSVGPATNPFAHVIGNLQIKDTVAIDSGAGVIQASAVVNYSVAVVQVTPPGQVVSTVPIIVQSQGQADAAASGTPGAGWNMQGGAGVTVGSFFTHGAAVQNFSNGSATLPPSASFNALDQADFIVNQEYSVQVIATFDCNAATNAMNNVNISFQAVADPVFTIDPNFPFKDDFALIYSANAPEPGMGGMLVGIAAGMFLRRSRARSRPSGQSSSGITVEKSAQTGRWSLISSAARLRSLGNNAWSN